MSNPKFIRSNKALCFCARWSLSLCFFGCRSLFAVSFGDRNLSDYEELGLDAPFYVFSDVENLRRLPNLEVSLVGPLNMQVVEPLVNLIPLEASVADSFGGRLLFHIDAFAFVDLSHNFDLFRSLVESHSSESSFHGILYHFCNFLCSWGLLSDFWVWNFNAIVFSRDCFQIRWGTIFWTFCLLRFHHLTTELFLSMHKLLLHFHFSVILKATIKLGRSFEKGSLMILWVTLPISFLYFNRDHT